ncbi:hypothetical protein D3C87_420000 [compost metagenome]
MVRAHSLLYAIYVCLIIALLCGALLYIATMYNQLNIFYTSHEELYIHNQSLVNYALVNIDETEPIEEEENEIQSSYEVKPYGLLRILTATSAISNDTVTSAHLVGLDKTDKTCVFVPSQGKSLSYAGNVKLIGDKKLPSDYIRPIYIDNRSNKLEIDGKVIISPPVLPELSENLKSLAGLAAPEVKLKDLPKSKDFYYNSFLKPTVKVILEAPELTNVSLKGNIILYSNDSIVISSGAVLEDVILVANKIYFQDNFKGSVQAFASEKIETGKNVELKHPSVLCVEASGAKSSIHIGKENKLYGAIVLHGTVFTDIQHNVIEIEEGSFIAGDIYCSGKLILKSNVYGAVYTNKFSYSTSSSGYDDCIADIEINAMKRPRYFVPVPLFENDKNYGTVKKVW